MADILVVDDDPGVRAVIREVLEDEGHRIVEESDGRAGLAAIFASSTPLVVLLDMRLPGLDGIGILRRIYEGDLDAAGRHAFILCTAGRIDFAEDVQKLLERGKVALLPKPFEIEALVAQVAEAARRAADR